MELIAASLQDLSGAGIVIIEGKPMIPGKGSYKWAEHLISKDLRSHLLEGAWRSSPLSLMEAAIRFLT